LLDVLEAAAAFDDESGRGMKCRLMRLDEHEAVEGRFLADSPRKPLERMRDAMDDLIRRSPLVEESRSNLFVFVLSHLGARFKPLQMSLLLEPHQSDFSHPKRVLLDFLFAFF